MMQKVVASTVLNPEFRQATDIHKARLLNIMLTFLHFRTKSLLNTDWDCFDVNDSRKSIVAQKHAKRS
ncbi:hypothetical protein ISN45_Aa03g019710 [Arabidopsis thaliana x Arabidopsis arenosa]|uniref:Uncharacterized protein n=2 Tax=Arabidopsis TaxID=3701 RepID=A0A8T2BB83_ARASU|nr:hypothetical protein ISN45_Aa03g019710 [Arabidopsis thaliana x Arabidopsis arenosa]KAG7582414.1 hypothetical protein ISN44_As08g020140 [Arabidopsis suecica]